MGSMRKERNMVSGAGGKELEGLVTVLVQLLTFEMAVSVGGDFALSSAAASPMLVMIWSFFVFGCDGEVKRALRNS